MKKLPKKFQGAEVVRGLGMNADKLDDFLDRKAMANFDATREMWIVVDNGALEDLDNSTEIKGFATRSEAVRVARAQAHGNIDQRVLRVTEQILVVATDNEL